MCKFAHAGVSAPAEDGKRIELPKHILPTSYKLTVTPDLENFTFVGHVDILLHTAAETEYIELNAHKLQIQSATVSTRGHSYKAGPAEYNEETQTVKLPLEATLAAGLDDVVLAIDFTGLIGDDMSGFYRSNYEDEGVKKTMVSTQFEAVDARKAFPCFDEPKHKATFTVTLVVPTHLTALCNTPAEAEVLSEDGKTRTVTFEPSPIMSTYLLAWAIGEFEWIEAYTRPTQYLPEPVRVRTYTTKGLINQGRFGLGVAVRTLELFSDVFGIAYPLRKLDQIAVPDFAAGAMENWGLVTYRTVALLLDDATGSIQSKQAVATTVTHELAHQWFGNLVTMMQWDELWLNEGFATWVGTYGAGKLFPEWDMWTQFVSDDQSYALTVDALRNSHPIQVFCADAKSIDSIFDAISYSKGGSVIHMLTQWLGFDAFFAGMRIYVQRHKYGNATTNDLWAALSETSGQNVNEFMSLWTSKIGYPVVKVTEEPIANGVRLHLEQHRFLRSGGVKPEDDTTVWYLPLNIATVSADGTVKVVTREVMKTKKLEVDLVGDANDEGSVVYLLNQDRSGFYRVAYPAAHVAKLNAHDAKLLTSLNVRDRMSLLVDSMALAWSGDAPTTQLLDLAAALIPRDRDYVVLSDAVQAFAQLSAGLAGADQATLESLAVLRRTVAAPHARRLGFDPVAGESPLTKLLRPSMIGEAGRNGDPATLAEARARFARFTGANGGKPDESAIASDLYRAVLGMVVLHGGEAEWETAFELFKSTPSVDLRYAALSSLSWAPTDALVKKTLALVMDTSVVRSGDIHYIIRMLPNNPKVGSLMFEWFTSSFKTLSERYVGNFGALGDAASNSVRSYATTRAKLDEARAFFADKDTKTYYRSLQQAFERAESNIEWAAREAAPTAEWLREFALQAKYGY
ncbi:aminopeptidase 2 [Blastocladiella britannica]|nr:aminopeptidase 2 [Blastocladiella britannica]